MVIQRRPESKDRDQIGHFGLLYSTTYNSQTDCLTGSSGCNEAWISCEYVVSCA